MLIALVNLNLLVLVGQPAEQPQRAVVTRRPVMRAVNQADRYEETELQVQIMSRRLVKVADRLTDVDLLGALVELDHAFEEGQAGPDTEPAVIAQCYIRQPDHHAMPCNEEDLTVSEEVLFHTWVVRHVA